MKLKATFIAAVMAVSTSSHAQERAAFGFRVGAQYLPDFCKIYQHEQESCTGTAPVIGPYVRLHIEGPHNLEMAGRFSVADYRISFTNNRGETLLNTKSVSLAYEHRPLGGDMAFRVGWHYSEAGAEAVANFFDSNQIPQTVRYYEDTQENGFIVGAGFDLFRGANLAVDWADWDGDEVLSMLVGFEI